VSEGATTNLTTATFGFGSSPAGATVFQCKLNLATAFSDCSSGLVLSGLAAGGQVLTVRAVDGLGRVGAEATRNWTVAALSTTIKTIRTPNAVPVDTLVTISTNVRVTGFGTQGTQVIFVQEAGPTSANTVDSTSDLTGSAVLNAAIPTRPLVTQAAHAEGVPVVVTGTLGVNGSSLELLRASYLWSTATATPYLIPTLRTSTVFGMGLEAVHVRIGAQIPSGNCSSSCYNSVLGNSYRCIETTCMDSGCTSTKILSWIDVSGVGYSSHVTSGYGYWDGWLIKRSAYYEFWASASQSSGDDVCL
jgi:hypothetical protein